jgi:hypothetical protein
MMNLKQINPFGITYDSLERKSGKRVIIAQPLVKNKRMGVKYFWKSVVIKN